jgi:uncharacterized membrane protein
MIRQPIDELLQLTYSNAVLPNALISQTQTMLLLLLLLSTRSCAQCSALPTTDMRTAAHLDGVAQCCCCCSLAAGEHDTGRVQQSDVLVQVDLLHALGHSWRAANLA